MKKKKISFIGCGNMGEAILNGVVDSSLLKPSQITFFEKDPVRREYIKTNYGIKPEHDISGAVNASRYLLLAVKPQNLSDLMEDLKVCFDKEKNSIISIIAGISTGFYEKRFGEGTSVVRVMPNAPALYKKGMITISSGKYAMESDLSFVSGLMGKVGKCILIDENLQHISTAINGSGPAYFFLFCKTLMEVASSNGLDMDAARVLVAGTMSGASEMIENSVIDMDGLISKVASPGGTTEKALETFKYSNFELIIKEAVKKALKRSKELEKEVT